MHCDRRGQVSQLQMVTSFLNIPTLECFMSSRPSPVGSWKAKVIEEACLSEVRSLSRLNSQQGAAKGRRLTNTRLWHSSSKSILEEASLPVASRWRQTLLMRMLW